MFPGRFDPVTIGHVDIALRGAKLFERLVVAVYDMPSSATLFSTEERVQFFSEAVADHPNVTVKAFPVRHGSWRHAFGFRFETADRTIVILTSDNGGFIGKWKDQPVVTNNAPLRSGKGSLYEGGLRVPLIILNKELKHKSPKFIKISLMNLTVTVEYRKSHKKRYIFSNFNPISRVILSQNHEII